MRLIDADVMLEELKDKEVVIAQQNIADWIDEQPTVDAEPVVHCKDCRWFESVNEETQWGFCTTIGLDDAWQYDDYCSYGVRKDGE